MTTKHHTLLGLQPHLHATPVPRRATLVGVAPPSPEVAPTLPPPPSPEVSAVRGPGRYSLAAQGDALDIAAGQVTFTVARIRLAALLETAEYLFDQGDAKRAKRMLADARLMCAVLRKFER